jgi:hypothetical protein
VPAYPSLTTGYKPLPPMRPLETLARRGRPRWGLRFLMLLIVAGGATYFLRPYISWIDNRVTPVENRCARWRRNTDWATCWLGCCPIATPARRHHARARTGSPAAPVALKGAARGGARPPGSRRRQSSGRSSGHRADLAPRLPGLGAGRRSDVSCGGA